MSESTPAVITIVSRWSRTTVLFTGRPGETKREAMLRAASEGANLSGAYLSGAYLSDANLSDADLSDANLSDADLSDANLSVIREDVRSVLAAAPAEAPGLLAALREGRVDGSTYEGPCACLVGTIANVRGVEHTALGDLRPDADRPAERFFMGIREGDTPETDPVSAIAAKWVEEFLAEQPKAEG